MELKADCQRTEVGVIPKDWSVVPLGHLGAWRGGLTPSMRNPDFWLNGTVSWVSSGDVKSSLISDTPLKITDSAVQISGVPILPIDSVMLVTRSGILRKHLPVAQNTVPLAINQDIKALIPNRHHVPSFIRHLLTHSGKKILSACLKSGTTVESLEFGWLKEFQVPVPTCVTEQSAIAGVLGGVDDLLNSLDALITKKRNLKRAAMQQLLTGQIRLPGFHGEWSAMQIGNIAGVKTGPFGSTLHERDYVSDGIPIITVEHLSERGVEHVNLPMVSETDSIRLGSYALRSGDIVFSRVGSIDRNALIRDTEAGWLFSGRLLRVRPINKLVHSAFLSYQFHGEHFRRSVQSVAVGQTMASLNTKILNGLVVLLPPIDEQAAIAEVLTEVDIELSTLEARRDKTRLLKLGMMQELLTGKTRLVPHA